MTKLKSLLIVFVAALLPTASITAASAPRAVALDAVGVETTPALSPSFDPEVTDYVVRCAGSGSISFTGTLPAGTALELENESTFVESFTTELPLAPGQGFTFSTLDLLTGDASRTYFVRCLPADFPNFSVERPGNPQAAYYVTIPSTLGAMGPMPPDQYVVIFDNHGTPVWWLRESAGPYANLLADGTIVSLVRGEPSILWHQKDGTQIGAVGPDATDTHDIQLLPNGNYLMAVNAITTGDLTFLGKGSSESVANQVIREIDPAGNVVWSWDAAAHIPVTDMDPQWNYVVANKLVGSYMNAYDIYHWNSLEQLGDDILISFRHLDAVYDVSRATGKIKWKLGGSPSRTKLTFVGDSQGNFGGQHYARFNGSTNSVSISDNGTGLGRAPRAVRYEIDTDRRTATLVEEVRDSLAPVSICCGNATRLAGGNWVMAWGFTPLITELSPTGERQLLIRWTDPGIFSYRAEPVPAGRLSITELRVGMNAQYLRGLGRG